MPCQTVAFLDPVFHLIRYVLLSLHRLWIHEFLGLCGEAPSSHPEFARFLVDAGIDSISVNPASFLAVNRNVHLAEVAIDNATGVR